MKGNCSYCEAEIENIDGRKGRFRFCNRGCRDKFYHSNKFYQKAEDREPKDTASWFNTDSPKQCRHVTNSCLNCPLPVCMEEMTRSYKMKGLQLQGRLV